MSKVKKLSAEVKITLVYDVEPATLTGERGEKYRVDRVIVTYYGPTEDEEEDFDVDLHGWRLTASGRVDRRQRGRERAYAGSSADDESFAAATFGIDWTADVAARYKHVAAVA